MPKRSSSVVPKYRKHKASGQAIATIQGKDHYLGPHGSAANANMTPKSSCNERPLRSQIKSTIHCRNLKTDTVRDWAGI